MYLLYLPIFHDQIIDTIQVEELLLKLHEANIENAKLSEENKILLKENDVLTKNISALYRTAISEIRKLKTHSHKGNKKFQGHQTHSRNQVRRRGPIPEN